MLIGRETELRVLEHLITGARVSRSGTLVVTGEAGIGKTSLIDAATSSVDGMNVLRAAGSPHEIGVAFGGLLQLLRPALGLIDAIPAPQSEALKVALAIRPGVPGDRFAIGAATLSLISRHAEDKPLVVVVDDAHDVDRPTAEALLFVARRLAADRVAIVMGARLGEPGLDTLRGLPELALAGLSEDAARSMLAAHATMTPEQAHRLHRATGGNPLAMVELADDPQSLDQLAPEVPVPAPAAVLQAFTRRATSLRPESRTALLAATIAGGDLTLAAAMCTQIGADVAALADAENADLVRIGVGTAEFRHPLVRSASYGAASTSDRRAMHQAAADALHDSDAERSAWNLSEAAVGPDETVAGQMSLTGDAARSRGGYDVAAIAYERAAALTPGDDPLIAERLLAAAENAWLAGRAEHALELLERADRPPAPEKITARMCELRGAVAARAGSLEQARSILVAGVSAHAESDPDAALLLASDAVDICFFLADAQTAATMVETITTLLPRSTTARSQVLGTMAAGVGLVLIGSPGAELIRQASAEMERSAVVENDPFRAAWLMFGPLFLRDSNARRDHLRKAVEDRRTTASIVALPYMLFKLARDDATTDRWDEADIAYEESIRLARDTGQLTDLAMSLSGLAWLQARRGRSEPCLENAAESAELCGRHHIHLGTAWICFARGELHLALGRAEEAIAEFTALEEILTGSGFADVDLSPGPETVDALLRSGHAQQARTVAREYERRAVHKGQPWAMARAERGLGMTATDEHFGAHFDAALALHKDTEDAFEVARTQLAYGSRLRRTRQRVAARPLLSAALTGFEALGAVPWADFAAVELEATGTTASRRGDSARDRLTAQELQIALMLGRDGLTTRQAAAALFLSPKTVEYHLRHVYTKLGISSRRAMAAAVQR